MHRPIRQLAVVALAAVLGGVVAAVVVTTTTGSHTTTVVREVVAGKTVAATSSSATSASKSVNGVFRSASPGVVKIVVSQSSGSDFPFGQGGGGSQSSQAQGSGWVYDTKGDIVTNQHVVAGAGSITVYLADGTFHPAKLVASDPSTDLAVIKVNLPTSQLHPLTLAASDNVEVGDGVVAIGTPFGLQNTVTWGIVSALHRKMTAPNGFYENAIQTDAAINHGNSGGPLLDMSGNVVGITTQIQSDSGGNEGVGFAVPASTIRTVVEQILSTGKIAHAYLGVEVRTIPAQVATAFGMAPGAEITRVVNGTGAAKAGLKGSSGQTRAYQGESFDIGGDVVTKVDGKAITGSDDLSSVIGSHKPGDTIQVTLVRSGQTRTVTVTLGAQPKQVNG